MKISKSTAICVPVLVVLVAGIVYRYETVYLPHRPFQWISDHVEFVEKIGKIPGLASSFDHTNDGQLNFVLRAQPGTNAIDEARSAISRESPPSWVHFDIQEVPTEPRLTKERAIEVADKLQRATGADLAKFPARTAVRDLRTGDWTVTYSSASKREQDYQVSVHDDPAQADLLIKKLP